MNVAPRHVGDQIGDDPGSGEGSSRESMMAQPWEPWHVSRGLRCISCGALHGLRDVIYRCGACGDLLDVVYRRPGETGAALAARFRVRQVSDLAIDRSGV